MGFPSGRIFGSALIIIGTVIGAGILALPLNAAPIGLQYSTLLLVGVGLVMWLTGLLMLEISLALGGETVSFSTMAERTLGSIGKSITGISLLLLLYTLTMAYISGASSLLQSILLRFFQIKLPNVVTALMFVTLLGTAVCYSTRATDLLNRSLLSVKGVLLLLTVILLMPHANLALLTANGSLESSGSGWGLILAAIPVFMCAFGYHAVIPSLCTYLGKQQHELKKVIFYSCFVALLVYLLWVWTVASIVPSVGSHSFAQIAQEGNSAGGLINAINQLVGSQWLVYSFTLFSDIAMTTSFLGVTLGLFDFIADLLKRPNSVLGRIQTGACTFLPPFLCAVYFPGSFLLGLRYASIFVTITSIILPVLMVYRLRYHFKVISPYTVGGGKILLYGITAVGILALVVELLLALGLLPLF